MSNLYGLTFQLEEPTPNKPTKVISIMVDEEGEKYINYLHQKLQQKENIIKELKERSLQYSEEIDRLLDIKEEVREYIENNSLYYQEYDYDYEENLVLGEVDDRVAKKELLEILDKENI